MKAKSEGRREKKKKTSLSVGRGYTARVEHGRGSANRADKAYTLPV